MCGAVPVQWVIGGTPLQLEAVRTAVWRGSAKVEGVHPELNGSLHKGPIQQHVWRERIVPAQRRCPGHLHFASPLESAPGGDRNAFVVGAAKPHRVVQLFKGSPKEISGVGRAPQVAHVAREHVEKRLELVRSKTHLDALLLWPLDLAA